MEVWGGIFTGRNSGCFLWHTALEMDPGRVPTQRGEEPREESYCWGGVGVGQEWTQREMGRFYRAGFRGKGSGSQGPSHVSVWETPRQENLGATIRRNWASRHVIRGGDLARKKSGMRQKPWYLLRKVVLGQLEAVLSRFVVTGSAKQRTVGSFSGRRGSNGNICHCVCEVTWVFMNFGIKGTHRRVKRAERDKRSWCPVSLDFLLDV